MCECGCGREVRPGNRFILGHFWKNKVVPDETKRKMSEAKKNKSMSGESRKKMSEARKGEKNPNWQNGISFEPYCHNFTEEIKEEVRDKFKRSCLLCGRTEKENKAKLGVHHYDYNKRQGCDEHQWKLVPLCRSCHAKTNFNREFWSEKIFEKLKEED